MDVLQRFLTGRYAQFDHIILSLVFLIGLSKLLGHLCRKLHQPTVLGEIISGILVGPSLLGWVHPGPVLDKIGEIGAVLLLFIAGIETNTALFKRMLNSAFLVAFFGVILPFIGGFFLCRYLGYSSPVSMMMGTILVSTSVSITVQVLKEMGKLETVEGTTILGAAVIDDFFGFLILSFVLALISSESVPINVHFIAELIFKSAAFLLTAFLGKMAAIRLIHTLRKKGMRQLMIFSLFGIAFGFASLAKAAGLSEAVGAYLIGMLLSPSMQNASRSEVISPLETIGNTVFIPVFFANIGLLCNLTHITPDLFGFAITAACLAILSKLIGCGLGASMTGMNASSSLRIGTGMIPRGEVGLIVSMIALQQGVINHDFLSVVVLVVVITTLMTPFLLKAAFADPPLVN